MTPAQTLTTTPPTSRLLQAGSARTVPPDGAGMLQSRLAPFDPPRAGFCCTPVHAEHLGTGLAPIRSRSQSQLGGVGMPIEMPPAGHTCSTYLVPGYHVHAGHGMYRWSIPACAPWATEPYPGRATITFSSLDLIVDFDLTVPLGQGWRPAPTWSTTSRAWLHAYRTLLAKPRTG